MGKRQRDQLQAGRIIKQIAPVLNMTVEELTHFFYAETFWKENSARHYLMGDTPWPFEDMGYDDCLEMVYGFLVEQQREGKLTKQDVEKKQEEVKRILKVAFVDLDMLSFHGRKLWATEKKEIVNNAYNNPIACLREPSIPYVHKDISNDIVEDPIETAIEVTMIQISNLDIETRYVLNRYFDAFSSITETDLKWIDFLDSDGERHITIDKLKRELSKKELPVNCGLILENMGSKDFQQWLELVSKPKGRYRDITRRMDSNRIDKLKSNLEKKVRSYNGNSATKLAPLRGFILYLAEKHNGSFFGLEQKYWKIFVLIKYWVSHFKDAPRKDTNIYFLQIEEERQP